MRKFLSKCWQQSSSYLALIFLFHLKISHRYGGFEFKFISLITVSNEIEFEMTKIMEKLFLTFLTRRMHTAIIEIKNEILQKYHCGVFYHKKLFNLKGFKNYFMNLNLKLLLSFPVIFLMSPHHITQKQNLYVAREKKAMIPFSTQLSTQSLTVDSSETYFWNETGDENY